jgi:hypothetical protein
MQIFFFSTKIDTFLRYKNTHNGAAVNFAGKNLDSSYCDFKTISYDKGITCEAVMHQFAEEFRHCCD